MLGANCHFGDDGVLYGQHAGRRLCQAYTKHNAVLFRIRKDVFQHYYLVLTIHHREKEGERPTKRALG